MKGVMLQGTASNVGKSVITTAICRMFTKQGLKISPFKAQNMSNHHVVLDTGELIAISQYEQAKAANREAETWMNPVLLKPLKNMETEVVFMGKSQGLIKGANFKDNYYSKALQKIKEGLLQAEINGDFIIIEGAGSPVEMNLKERDLSNMAIAELADVPVLLVADIERGGVFASVVGTLALLTEKERSRIKGVIINKFAGKPSLFTDGIDWLENYTKLPVLGVIPYIQHQLEEEDRLYGTEVSFQPKLIDKETDYDRLANDFAVNIDTKKLLEIMEGAI
ncbi:cobyric acid synthase [Tetragenococcus halophilus]|uniref:cobyric acid synthase n=1 Tax=Tetragenococcus halophilus TaxID=51669 RepID=UPI00077CC757|nr:cobyric acid synthase [Tetragenococcus halophilus]